VARHLIASYGDRKLPLQHDSERPLLSLLLRGRTAPGMRVFDAGCGGGRNLVHLLREGDDVCGNDADPRVRSLA